MTTITDERPNSNYTIAMLDNGDFFEYGKDIYVCTDNQEVRAFNFSTNTEEEFVKDDTPINYIKNVEIILNTF